MQIEAPYIDFHNHSKWNGNDVLEVVSIDGHKLKEAHFYTIGYHPWWITKQLTTTEISLLQSRFEDDERCLGLGECGLDGLKGPSASIQENTFLQQVELANKLNAPLVIHCVRAFDRLLSFKKKYGKTSWTIHGFVRNKILAKQILDAGCNISIAPDYRMTATFTETLQYLPLDRFFIETDSDFILDIKQRYKILSELRKITEDKLKTAIFSNFTAFYKEKWKYPNGWKGQIS